MIYRELLDESTTLSEIFKGRIISYRREGIKNSDGKKYEGNRIYSEQADSQDPQSFWIRLRNRALVLKPVPRHDEKGQCDS
jgi:hypothetical protein